MGARSPYRSSYIKLQIITEGDWETEEELLEYALMKANLIKPNTTTSPESFTS